MAFEDRPPAFLMGHICNEKGQKCHYEGIGLRVD
jgi:hypothetical protein